MRPCEQACLENSRGGKKFAAVATPIPKGTSAMSQLLDTTYAVAPFRTSNVVPLLRDSYRRTQWCAAVADAVGLR